MLGAIGAGGEVPLRMPPVRAGLQWLAKAQEPDGSWSCKRWGGNADWDLGVTGLSLLAFEGAGYTHITGTFKETVAKGIQWLRAKQKADGSFGWKTFDEQGIATLAIAEAYGLTESRELRSPVQKAIDYIVKVQPVHGGFGPQGPVPKDNGDMLTTTWQILAIRGAILAGIAVPQEAVDRSKAFLKSTYRGSGASARVVASKDPEPLATALGLFCRMFLYDAGCEDETRAAADWLRAYHQKSGSAAQGQGRLVGDLDYTYFSAASMFMMGLERSEEWMRAYRAPLIAAQVEEEFDAVGRFIRGSWDPTKHHPGDRYGRVYTTAMAVLPLEGGSGPRSPCRK